MKRLAFILSTVLILLNSLLAQAQNNKLQIEHIRFQYLTTNDGLAQNTVDCIVKDHQGFMWFGTWKGLCRYDGYSFKTYEKGHEPLGLPDNFIHTIREDAQENLWIGTGRGLACLDKKTGRFVDHARLKENVGNFSILDVLIDQQQRLWIATQNNGLWYVDLRTSGDLKAIKIDGKLLPDRHVNKLALLGNHDLFVGTALGMAVIDLDNLSGNNHWSRLHEQLDGQNIQSVLQDSRHNIWVGTDGGLYLYEPAGDRLSYFGVENGESLGLNHLSVTDIAEDVNGTIIVGTLGGLNYFQPDTRGFIHLSSGEDSPNKNLNNPFVNSLFTDDLGNVWIGTEKGGANYYNTYQKPFYALRHEPANPKTISQNTINSILKEDEVLWVGTAGGGLNRISKDGEVTKYEADPGKENSISSDFVTSILRDENNNLWIGTWGGGLNQMLSEKRGNFSVYNHVDFDPNSLCSDFVSSQLQLDKNRILIGTLRGLDIFQLKSRTFLHVHEKMNLQETLEVGCLLLDNHHRLWVGTRNGLYRFKEKDIDNFTSRTSQIKYDTFFNQPSDSVSLPGNYVISLLETKDGAVWIGTYGSGVCKFVEDGDNGHFVRYTEEEGLCNNVAYAMEQDLQGNIWISTDMGLSKFDPENETFQNYFVKDGLLSDQFYWSASYADSSGMLYFGGINGLNYFRPQDIELYPNSFKPVFTEFSIYNKPVRVGQKYHSRVVLNKPIGETKNLELSYKDAVFSIEFSALDYFLPEKIKYQYKMVGVDQDWVTVSSNRRFANYTNLAGGNYLFQVRATNSDGVWSDKIAELNITVQPPFWKTAWFQLLVIFAIALLVMAYIRYRTAFLKEQKRKLEKQVKERTQKIEEQKQELEVQAENLKLTNQQLAERQVLIEGQKVALEQQNEQIASQRDEVIELNEKVNLVNQLRLRFFTNISHEFRTPLTLIIDPLEKLMKSMKGDRETTNTLKIIDRNAQRLLHLINQLIYFRRIETGKLVLRVSKGDLAGFLKSIFESFNDLAYHQNIDYQFIAQKPPKNTWFDSEKLENVFYNLLSNAFKYTSPGGKIRLQVSFVDQDSDSEFPVPYVCIQVIDTGKGIAAENLAYIFDRFYQVESAKKDAEMSSSGIGLALTHEIVKALHGEMKVESELGKGSTFIVRLPYTKERFDAKEINQTAVPVEVNLEGRVDVLTEYIDERATNFENKETDRPEDKTKPLVLIVEDNFDLRNFLVQTLRSDYRTLGAEDGKEGLAMAKKYSPELIISDVMMPVMDGIELCSRLKKDIQSSHIPIILLTAKNMVESWVEGLETGADDYIPKPFNLQILQVKMNNLVESRRKLKRMFSNSDSVEPSELTSNTVDEEFISRAYKILEQNYTEPEFSASQFASEMFVSRSLLYKKIRAITDLNITDFINSFKLKKAVGLIQRNNLPIADIAFNVGFNDPKYFSRIFRKFYGMSPSEFQSKKVNI
ncbi:MAG TPA: two-component regulator propeller domain-containing protein [Sunxiuqinia sp.]|nr:two-component regulator propeller domain-containing protein [Sunxiuqinia sp.]